MDFARRTAFLRLTAMAALVASAILTSDALNPGRAFCPLEAACNAARNSDLGSFFGVPTSVLGIAAFGGLFLLTLLPIEWTRHLLWPLGFLGGAAGIVFAGYQVFVLQSFCPLCIVADAAGFLAAIITLTWPDPPIRLSGKRATHEPHSSRAGWTLAASLAVVLPLIWPRPAEPAWVEITPVDETAFEDQEVVEAVSVEVTRAEPAEEPGPVETPAAPPVEEPQPVVTLGPPLDAAMVTNPVPAPPVAEPAPERPEPPGPQSATEPTQQAPVEREPAPVREAPRGPLVVEYLNAFCPHCRKTHRRLQRVIAKSSTPVRKRRVYTWGGSAIPLWARACAFAHKHGLEERMFEELLKARTQRPADIYAAAQRAGLDPRRMQAALRTAPPSRRLLRDQRLVRKAQLRVLPTLDIGRRRLQGEQSESELRDAITAAAELLTARR